MVASNSEEMALIILEVLSTSCGLLSSVPSPFQVLLHKKCLKSQLRVSTYLWMAKHWNSFPKVIVESLSFED